MKTTFIIASLFAAIATAAPAAVPVNGDSAAVEVEARQTPTIRVQMSQDATDTAAQAEIPVNSRVLIRESFRSLGNPVQANRAFVVSGSGTCNIFSDRNAQQRVATIKSGGTQAKFGKTNLQNGVIVCQSWFGNDGES